MRTDKYGIKIKDDQVESQLPPVSQNELFSREDISWWFIYRAELICLLMEKYFSKDDITYDIGGGNGYSSNEARKRGFNIGLIEPAYDGCVHAHMRGIENIICGAFTDTLFEDASIKQMLLLDVLEHIEEDLAFLKLLNKKCMNDGKVIITVPAFNSLWSSEDDFARHFKRYKLKGLKNKAEKAGFTVVYGSYFFSFLYLPILFIRHYGEKLGIFKRKDEKNYDEWKKMNDREFKSSNKLVLSVLRMFERLESERIKRGHRIMFGSSIIMVMKKTDK